MADHHAHAHNHSKAGTAVVLSLVLFFLLSAAGHFIFVMNNAETSAPHFAPAAETDEPAPVHAPDVKPLRKRGHRNAP